MLYVLLVGVVLWVSVGKAYVLRTSNSPVSVMAGETMGVAGASLVSVVLIIALVVGAIPASAQEVQPKIVTSDVKGTPYEGIGVEQFAELTEGLDVQYKDADRLIMVDSYYHDYTVTIYYINKDQRDCFQVGSSGQRVPDRHYSGDKVKVQFFRSLHKNKPHCTEVPAVLQRVVWKFKRGEKYEKAKHDEYVRTERLSVDNRWTGDLGTPLNYYYVLHSTFSVPLGNRANGNLMFSQKEPYEPDKYYRLYGVNIPPNKDAPGGTKGKSCFFVAPKGAYFKKHKGWSEDEVVMNQGHLVEVQGTEVVYSRGKCGIRDLDYNEAVSTSFMYDGRNRVGYQGITFPPEPVDDDKEFLNPRFKGADVLMYVPGGVKYLEVINQQFEELKKKKEGGSEEGQGEGDGDGGAGDGGSKPPAEGSGVWAGMGDWAADVLKKVPDGYGRADLSKLDNANAPLQFLREACKSVENVQPRSVEYGSILEAFELSEKNFLYLTFVPNRSHMVKASCVGTEPLIKAYEFATLPVIITKAFENTAGDRTLGHVLRDYSFVFAGGPEKKTALGAKLYAKVDIKMANAAGTMAIGFPLVIRYLLKTVDEVKKLLKGK